MSLGERSEDEQDDGWDYTRGDIGEPAGWRTSPRRTRRTDRDRRNGSILGPFGAGVSLGGAGSTVEGLRLSGTMGLGIVATGIVRGNIAVGLFAPGGESGIGISATGVITGNYVSGNKSGGIFAGQGSTVIGNTVMSGGFFFGMEVQCPSNVTDNTVTGSNLVLNGTGCNNTNNVAP